MTDKIAIGVDIGGSHINCCALDVKSNSLLKETQTIIKVDGHAEAKVILQKWGEALRATIRKAKDKELIGIGFAMPSPFDYSNGIGKFELVDKFENLNNVDIQEELRNVLSLDISIPIRFINDATAFALGESYFGQGKEFKKVAVITLGTGFGSAFINENVPVVTGETVPEYGCVWHLPFKEDIADAYFSTRWFVNEYEKLTEKKMDGVKPIADLADTNPEANKLFKTFGTNLAEFISPYLNQFNTDALVMGGNITGAFSLFEQILKDGLIQSGLDITISLSTLKEDAAIFGSTCLLDSELWKGIEPTLKYM